MSVGNGTLLTFSPEGERLAQSGVDGVLKIWDVRTGQLEQEYQPAAHLVAGATCIKFSPVAHQCNGEAEESTPGKKKKKKKKDVAYEQRYSLVAMGSKNGNVLLYSPENRELVTQLSHSPPHPILDIAWLSPTRLFSLANDTLVLWNVNTGKRVYTCEVSSGVVSICAFGAKEVCVGSSKIQDIRVMKKGDIGTAKERKNFTGHTSKTIQLLPILGTDVATKYFFSAAKDDRFIYAWNLNGEGEEPCANFLVKDAVYSMAVGSGTQDNVVSLAVTTRKGALVYFTEHLNGNLQKRVVKLKGKLTVCSESDGVKQPVPILASCFLNDIENSIMIVYGNASFMKFERLKVEQLTGKQELVRQVKTASSSSSSRGMEKKTSKTVTPKVTEEANILGPSNITLPEGGEAKRKRDDPDGKATLPMEERLSALAIDKVTPHSTLHGPRSDDQVHLLLQGLQSKDHQLLHPVLSCNSSEVINNTVKRLPSQAVAPLLRYLQQAIEDKGVRHYSYVPWLRGVLYHHMSFLSTLPDREALVLPFYRLAMSTMSSLVQMMQLQARLDLLLTHVTTRHQGAKEQQQDHPALLTYEDDSSSDDYLLPGASESEDNWDELSEFGGDINGHTDDSDMEVDPDATTSSSKNKRKKDSASSPDDDDDDDDDEPTALESDSESNSKDNDNQDSECESEEEEEEEKENEEEVDEEEEEEEEEENEEDEEEDEEEEEENEDEEEERRGRRRN